MNAIIYTTNTGSTEHYAKLLAQKTGLPVYSLAEAKKRGFAGAEVIYLGLDHGRLGQGLCRGRKALSGTRRLRCRHGTGRNANGQRAEKVGDSSRHSAVHTPGEL